jgi:hypothetical protein
MRSVSSVIRGRYRTTWIAMFQAERRKKRQANRHMTAQPASLDIAVSE